MAFTDCFFSGENSPPAKFYLHQTGRAAFGRIPVEIADNASEYARKALEDWNHYFSSADFVIGFLWGNREKKKKVADVFGAFYDGDKENNPEIKSWVVDDGKLVRGYPITCGEGIQLLADELQSYRRTGDIARFLEGHELFDKSFRVHLPQELKSSRINFLYGN